MPFGRACRIYMRAAGIQGVDDEVLSILGQASRLAVNLETVEERYEIRARIVRKAGTPAVVLRTRGDRTFEEIPPAEIGEMMNCLRAQDSKLHGEALLQAVLKHYEIEDMTPGMRARLSQIKAQYMDRSGD